MSKTAVVPTFGETKKGENFKNAEIAHFKLHSGPLITPTKAYSLNIVCTPPPLIFLYDISKNNYSSNLKA